MLYHVFFQYNIITINMKNSDYWFIGMIVFFISQFSLAGDKLNHDKSLRETGKTAILLKSKKVHLGRVQSKIQGINWKDPVAVNIYQYPDHVGVYAVLEGTSDQLGLKDVSIFSVDEPQKRYQIKAGAIQIFIPIQGVQTHVVLKAISQNRVIGTAKFDIEYPGWDPSKISALGKSASQDKTFTMLAFRLTSINLFNSSGTGYSGMLNWTPGYGSSRFRIHLDLGTTVLKSFSGSSFFVIEYGLLGSARVVKSLWIEALLGMQYWAEQTTSHSPLVGGNLSYRWDENTKPFSFVDQIYLGYAAFLGTTLTTQEIKLGVGISF